VTHRNGRVAALDTGPHTVWLVSTEAPLVYSRYMVQRPSTIIFTFTHRLWLLQFSLLTKPDSAVGSCVKNYRICTICTYWRVLGPRDARECGWKVARGCAVGEEEVVV
jgi:hypothetical protein